MEPVTLERLRQGQRIHASRNPRLVRALTEWGYMRELGEGNSVRKEIVFPEGRWHSVFLSGFQMMIEVFNTIFLGL